MDLETIREKLKDRRLGLVAKKTGLHYNTLRELRDNPASNPTWSTISSLVNYFKADEDKTPWGF